MQKEILLASASPRRRQLLDQIGVRHDTLAPDIDETPHAGEEAADCVLRLARAKAAAGVRLAAQGGLALRPVLAADTVVAVDGLILGKPADADDARAMLRRLSGREHRVLTGVALAWDGRVETALSDSVVAFAPLPDDWLAAYLASGEPFGKAGAYAVQGRAAAMIRHIRGSYSGIMGLPLFETAALLRRAAGEAA